ncbi:MAG: hypothetical protein DBY32_11390 [Phascolarctobacterium sp.]|nr:MAG: hypothetical protein DBY32_11390 [Phascolarctobacterium sp.]
MLFEIYGERKILNHERYLVTLRSYKNGQASPDCFADFEINVPRTCQRAAGDDAYLITERQFLQVLIYWMGEVEDFNADRVSEQFGDRLEQANIDFMDLYVEGMED